MNRCVHLNMQNILFIINYHVCMTMHLVTVLTYLLVQTIHPNSRLTLSISAYPLQPYKTNIKNFLFNGNSISTYRLGGPEAFLNPSSRIFALTTKTKRRLI